MIVMPDPMLMLAGGLHAVAIGFCGLMYFFIILRLLPFVCRGFSFEPVGVAAFALFLAGFALALLIAIDVFFEVKLIGYLVSAGNLVVGFGIYVLGKNVMVSHA